MDLYSYAIPSEFDNAVRIGLGLSASDAPGGRYNKYFHAISLSATPTNIEDLWINIHQVEEGIASEYIFGDYGWALHVTRDRVRFENDDFEEINNREDSSFEYPEFKWAFMAWWEFLLTPEISENEHYAFNLPLNTICKLQRPGGLLSKSAQL
ncbi:hypothetical protein [Lysobacter enzymogenes]|uniref:hypothetical protein n=1 Tax=Lysobacter enzymogenes TaxID=69 RepID=UPI001A966D59|nr:hypothetical protein [Lysobacter enzymogenes]QQP98187.1 hypothetical protein JHW38_09425 [Lysobacter enzymogenes]